MEKTDAKGFGIVIATKLFAIYTFYFLMIMKHLVIIISILALGLFCNSCAEKSQAQEKTATITLSTAKCETCKKNIEKALKDVPGVNNAIVSTKAPKSVTVVYNASITSEQKICEVISKAGYNANGVSRDTAAYEKLDACCK